MHKVFVTVLAALPHLGSQAAAQAVVVKQGTVVPVERFESPMVLDLPLVLGAPGVQTSALRTQEEQKRTRKLICDGAYLHDLTLRRGKPNKDGSVDLDGKLTIAAEHGEDRRVDVLTEIIRGEEVLATSPKITNLKVEEDERTTRPVTFQLSQDQLVDPTLLKVRLTLEVRSPKDAH